MENSGTLNGLMEETLSREIVGAGLAGAECQWLQLGEAGLVCWEWGKCGVGTLPSLRDDEIEERFIGFAKAGEADLEDHCLNTLLLERKSSEC